MGAEIRLNEVQVVHTVRGGSEPVRVTALDCVDLVIEAGSFMVVSGGRGSGKTTVLDVVSGLTEPSSGAVLVDGEPVDGPGPHRSTVLRHFTLLPWRTVAQNVEFALESIGGWTRTERAEIAMASLHRLGIGHLADDYPETLAPLAKQRVAFARALATDPGILLLDEPFGQLTPADRSVLAADLLRLWRTGRFTVLFATSDLAEAHWFGQRIVELGHGRVRRIYRPVPRAA